MSNSEKQTRCSFFLTGNDLISKFNDFVLPLPMHIVRYGVDLERKIDTYKSVIEIPDLGVSVSGVPGLDNQYWFVKQGVALNLREIKHPDGHSLYTIDPKGVELVQFSPGGLFNNDCMIAGEVAVRTSDRDLLSLQNLIAKHIRRRSTSVDGFWLGQEAIELFRGGMRFTTGVESTYKLVDYKGVLGK